MSFKSSAGIVSGLFCALLLASCATMKAAGMKYPVYVTDTHVVDLLPSQNMERRIDELYLINGKFGRQSFTIQAYMLADENGIFINLLNDFGTDMGRLSYDGRQLSFDSAVFPKTLKAQYITLDIQYTYYAPGAVRSALADAGLQFTVETNADGTEIRKVMDGKKCVEEITKSAGTVKIVNYLRGYEYDLTEAEQ